MPKILPVRQSLYDQTNNIQIDNKTYTFRYRYNQTEIDDNGNGAWYCYIGRIAEDPKVKFKIVNGIDLLAPWVCYEEVPQGSLFVFDNDLTYGRPGKDTFYSDGRFFMIFIAASEDLTPLINVISSEQ